LLFPSFFFLIKLFSSFPPFFLSSIFPENRDLVVSTFPPSHPSFVEPSPSGSVLLRYHSEVPFLMMIDKPVFQPSFFFLFPPPLPLCHYPLHSSPFPRKLWKTVFPPNWQGRLGHFFFPPGHSPSFFFRLVFPVYLFYHSAQPHKFKDPPFLVDFFSCSECCFPPFSVFSLLLISFLFYFSAPLGAFCLACTRTCGTFFLLSFLQS